jgi:hypothetical protein
MGFDILKGGSLGTNPVWDNCTTLKLSLSSLDVEDLNISCMIGHVLSLGVSMSGKPFSCFVLFSV